MGRTIQLGIKRAFDGVVSIAALVVLSPLMALIVLAIKRDSPGPVLFAQERVGKDGKPFRCYKFRTMVTGAEKMGLGLEVAKDDARITRVGSFLRPWGLDEIPQLLNILKGNMSIVGPRPTVLSQVARYTSSQRRRLEVKPGLVGWAVIHGRNRLPWSKRIELDVWYVDHWSLWLDIKILIRLIGVILRNEGVYGDDGIVKDLE